MPLMSIQRQSEGFFDKIILNIIICFEKMNYLFACYCRECCLLSFDIRSILKTKIKFPFI